MDRKRWQWAIAFCAVGCGQGKPADPDPPSVFRQPVVRTGQLTLLYKDIGNLAAPHDVVTILSTESDTARLRHLAPASWRADVDRGPVQPLTREQAKTIARYLDSAQFAEVQDPPIYDSVVGMHQVELTVVVDGTTHSVVAVNGDSSNCVPADLFAAAVGRAGVRPTTRP